jgi:beta-glucosidase-like glycosyl hydrolase
MRLSRPLAAAAFLTPKVKLQADNSADGDRLLKAVKSGKVKKSRIDEMATRILRPWFASGQADDWKKPNYYWWSLNDEWNTGKRVFKNKHVDPRQDDASDFARRVAEESHV